MKRVKGGFARKAVAHMAFVLAVSSCATGDNNELREAIRSATATVHPTVDQQGAAVDSEPISSPITSTVPITEAPVSTATTLSPSSTSPATTTATTTTVLTTTTTTTTTSTLPSLGVEITSDSLLAVLDTLTVVPEAPLRQGYDRALFPHWQDLSGSGCTTRQDALLAQVVGFPQRDLFDACVVVEGDWYSLYDGVTFTGSPSEIDAEHVVALAEAWDSGAAGWPTSLRRQFANDPLNVLIVTRASNQAKADKDAGEWKPPRRDAWCVTATMMIHTKARYSLTVDARERDGLEQMAAACDEPDQRGVPGLPLPGTPAFAAVSPVVIPPPTSPPPPPPPSGNCGPGQVDINRASETDVQRIIHIGPERAPVLISLRPYTSVSQLTRINGIGDGRLRDIIAQGVACV